MSENSSLLSAEDTGSERVRFDDNVSFIDERGVLESDVAVPAAALVSSAESLPAKLHKVSG